MHALPLMVVALCVVSIALGEVTDGAEPAQPGTVTFLQHFGSTLHRHVHFHLPALDGVDESPGENAPLAFVPAPRPRRAATSRTRAGRGADASAAGSWLFLKNSTTLSTAVRR